MPVTVRWTPTKQDVRLAARTARLSASFAARHGIRLVRTGRPGEPGRPDRLSP